MRSGQVAERLRRPRGQEGRKGRKDKGKTLVPGVRDSVVPLEHGMGGSICSP